MPPPMPVYSFHPPDTWSTLFQIRHAKFDYSAKGILEEFLYIKWGSEGFLEISKEDIVSVEVQKSFLSKKCIVTLKDGSRHTFNYGAMNIDKCAAAIQTK